MLGLSPTYTVDPILLPSGNPLKCHEEVLSSQPMIPPKRFDLFPPLAGGCSEGLDAFRFFFKYFYLIHQAVTFSRSKGKKEQEKIRIKAIS